MQPARSDETRIGGDRRAFPLTSHSAVADARSDDPARARAAHDALVRAYWKPCYAYLRDRRRVSNEDAKELVQGFFLRALERGVFARFDPAKGSFRGFVRGALENHARSVHEARSRAKRGGNAGRVDVDDVTEPADPAPTPDQELDLAFQREWRRHALELGVAALRELCEREGRRDALAAFERYDLHDAARGARPTYAEIARELAIAPTQVTNHLHWARGKLRELVLLELRSAAGDDREWRDDVRELFGPRHGLGDSASEAPR